MLTNCISLSVTVDKSETLNNSLYALYLSEKAIVNDYLLTHLKMVRIMYYNYTTTLLLSKE
jgi:hypothetical protein